MPGLNGLLGKKGDYGDEGPRGKEGKEGEAGPEGEKGVKGDRSVIFQLIVASHLSVKMSQVNWLSFEDEVLKRCIGFNLAR